jgi:hypothetical protein
MSVTHGGRFKTFEWDLRGDRIFIENSEGRVHIFYLLETYKILKWLKLHFGENPFPLANNVALMGKGEEKNGLGTAILNQPPNKVRHAQGASYLGVVLEEVGIFEWNGAKWRIKWQIIKMPSSINALNSLITDR